MQPFPCFENQNSEYILRSMLIVYSILGSANPPMEMPSTHYVSTELKLNAWIINTTT